MRTLHTGVLLAAAFAPMPLAAVDFVVSRYDDPAPNGCVVGDCSLREASMAANAGLDADRILLSAGRYELTIPGVDDTSAGGDIDLIWSVEIVGPGATMTIVDGNQLDAVFHALNNQGNVTLRGLTILGGITSNGHAFGVQAAGSSMLIEDCEIRGDEPGTTGNGVTANGGIFTMRRSTVSAVPGNGLNAGNSAVVTLENVSISGSGSNELIGIGASMTISNSTLAASADANPDVNFQASSTVTMENTIVVGQCAIAPGSTLTSIGGNLQAPLGGSCGFTQTFDQNVADAALGGLGANGGPTRTMRPGAGSLAVDTSSDANCLLHDQRSVERPQDGDGLNGAQCDSGAVELSAVDPPTPIFHDGFQQLNRGAWSDSVP